MTKHDKVARIIGLAEEMGIKIDTRKKGDKHDRPRKNKKVLSDKP